MTEEKKENFLIYLHYHKRKMKQLSFRKSYCLKKFPIQSKKTDSSELKNKNLQEKKITQKNYLRKHENYRVQRNKKRSSS